MESECIERAHGPERNIEAQERGIALIGSLLIAIFEFQRFGGVDRVFLSKLGRLKRYCLIDCRFD